MQVFHVIVGQGLGGLVRRVCVARIFTVGES
jgi:hypothetical protein